MNLAPTDTEETVEQTRVRRFRHITQTEYQRLQQLVLRRLRGSLAAHAEDAFAHACCAATQHYDGQVQIEFYILRVAQNWSISQWRKRKSEFSFTELERDGQQPAEWVPTAAIPDPQFYTFAKQLLKTLAWHATKSSDACVIRRAERSQAILSRFIASAEFDLGLGMDEYDAKGPREWITMRIAVEFTNGGVAEARKTLTFLRHIAAQVKAMYPELLEH